MPPLCIGSGLGLHLGGGPLLDPAASAYLAAVETAKGSAVTPPQRSAINAFILAEKSAARWDLHKRLYLPIWGQAAANAICLRSLATGTFVGGVTHGAGFVTGDATTGYFNTGASMVSIGASVASASFGFLHADSTRNIVGQDGAAESATQRSMLFYSNLPQIFFDHATFTNRVTVGIDNTGIISAVAHGGNCVLYRRIAASRAAAGAGPISGGALAGINMLFCARHGAGSIPEQFNTKKFGAMWMALGMSDADDAAFTLNLKTLWETCTGLTLP